nr:PREDICTED: secretory calcium-binding phosphoprotein proline-glutamine rich 1 isoform X2 [Anolis carolinensis]|eukprot:XP_016849017.1 PREDICTED: secretory calcium-binding phosphoprotein proline-glutamine rich 1 isoform X2 [Anolis carolinensis]
MLVGRFWVLPSRKVTFMRFGKIIYVSMEYTEGIYCSNETSFWRLEKLFELFLNNIVLGFSTTMKLLVLLSCILAVAVAGPVRRSASSSEERRRGPQPMIPPMYPQFPPQFPAQFPPQFPAQPNVPPQMIPIPIPYDPAQGPFPVNPAVPFPVRLLFSAKKHFYHIKSKCKFRIYGIYLST